MGNSAGPQAFKFETEVAPMATKKKAKKAAKKKKK
jgi:hypothetical protein